MSERKDQIVLCQSCLQEFGGDEALAEHIRREHPGEVPPRADPETPTDG